MGSESMNPDENDEVMGSGNDAEEEQQYTPWGRQAPASPVNSGGEGDGDGDGGAAGEEAAEEVSNDDSQAKGGEDGGVSQDGNGADSGDAAVPPLEKENHSQVLAFAENFDDEGDGTEEEQLAFVRELEKFFRDRNMEWKAPKFYGEELNCLKLWKAVMRLGGYEQVTSGKLWRQVGESFKPPKTCTTISWSFRGFYEKALLEYERFTTGVVYQDAFNLDNPRGPEDAGVQPQGRARRDAAARAMSTWHKNGDVTEPLLKDKSSAKRDKRVTKTGGGSAGFPKRKDGGKSKYSNSYDEPVKKKVKHELVKGKVNGNGVQSGIELEVIDEGPQADWVKINVHQTRDCFEVYALVPGLLREEVRIQCEVGGRLVIAGEPEQPDNPWGVTAFRKVINLPMRIDAHQTSAVVTLHGQLFIRVPFAQSEQQG